MPGPLPRSGPEAASQLAKRAGPGTGIVGACARGPEVACMRSPLEATSGAGPSSGHQAHTYMRLCEMLAAWLRLRRRTRIRSALLLCARPRSPTPAIGWTGDFRSKRSCSCQGHYEHHREEWEPQDGRFPRRTLRTELAYSIDVSCPLTQRPSPAHTCMFD